MFPAFQNIPDMMHCGSFRSINWLA